MAVPILLVSGFLGAGKTTLINRLLSEPDGRRIAAVVNDFGAVDIDAALLAGVSSDVVSLRNGCICCSLQGDLLQTLSALLRRQPPPDAIVIETSGVSDPAEIVHILLDPVIWREAALETVLCLADARLLADDPAMLGDRLFRSQIRAADFVGLTKADMVTPQEHAEVGRLLGQTRPGLGLHDAPHGVLPHELLFSGRLHVSEASSPSRFSTPGFESVSWTATKPLSLACFQAAVVRLGGRLVRAKGIVSFAEHLDTPMVFQMVGQRATLSPAPPMEAGEAVRLVFIARNGALADGEMAACLETCIA
ncbi:MAG: CobW family GTP-binding protein [Janthinobacterium lividum]